MDRRVAIGVALIVVALTLAWLLMFVWLPFGDKESPKIEPEPPERGTIVLVLDHHDLRRSDAVVVRADNPSRRRPVN